MFGWFRRKTTPPPVAADVAAPQPNPTEQIDAAQLLADVLASADVRTAVVGEWLELDNGLILRPQITDYSLRDDGDTRSITIIEVMHAELCPDGLFEYQHSIGKTLEDAVRKGFDGWQQVDLPVFEEALNRGERQLMLMTKETSTTPPVKRQIIFGPTVHYASRELEGSNEEESFCPCCLFTNSIEAFSEQLDANSFYGIRLYACRDADGVANADCRINGQDWQAGKEALIKYVANWPERGFEFRKQFVAIRTLPDDASEAQK